MSQSVLSMTADLISPVSLSLIFIDRGARRNGIIVSVVCRTVVCCRIPSLVSSFMWSSVKGVNGQCALDLSVQPRIRQSRTESFASKQVADSKRNSQTIFIGQGTTKNTNLNQHGLIYRRRERRFLIFHLSDIAFPVLGYVRKNVSWLKSVVCVLNRRTTSTAQQIMSSFRGTL